MLSTTNNGPSLLKVLFSHNLVPISVAASLPSAARKSLAIEVLPKTEPVSQLAIQRQVSRKFLYQ